MKVIILKYRNETFASIFISVNLTESNIHSEFANVGSRDEIRLTVKI